MAIKVGGTEVITNSRELSNIASIDAATVTALEAVISTDSTLGTLTKSFSSGESATVTLSSSVSPTAVVAVTKEVGQTGVSSKGAWDVASDAGNYELYNEAPATSLSFSASSDISTASYSQNFSVSAQDTYPSALHFKSDGTKMYVVGGVGVDVNEYNLSTAWDVSTASYGQNFSVSAQEIAPEGIFFKTDGTKMYIAGHSGDDVNEYNLSTAWDISTASFLQAFSVAAQETLLRDVAFSVDGTKMYILGNIGEDVNEYDLSTAWDVSTASYSQSFSHSGQSTDSDSLFFKSDGTKMYILDSGDRDVNEYDLSTAWDVSTATYSTQFTGLSNSGERGMFFKSDGTKMYVTGNTDQNVKEYDVPVSLFATLGTGSFSSSDVGKRIFVDDGGEALLTATDGSYSLVTAFGASSYTSGNWSCRCD